MRENLMKLITISLNKIQTTKVNSIAQTRAQRTTKRGTCQSRQDSVAVEVTSCPVFAPNCAVCRSIPASFSPAEDCRIL